MTVLWNEILTCLVIWTSNSPCMYLSLNILCIIQVFYFILYYLIKQPYPHHWRYWDRAICQYGPSFSWLPSFSSVFVWPSVASLQQWLKIKRQKSTINQHRYIMLVLSIKRRTFSPNPLTLILIAHASFSSTLFYHWLPGTTKPIQIKVNGKEIWLSIPKK